jgi:hypothetical protein
MMTIARIGIVCASLFAIIPTADSAYSKDPEPLVTNIKVIRRGLEPLTVKAERGAHSALLLTTDNPGAGSGGTYVLEYMGDSNVYLTPAKLEIKSIDEADSTMEIEADGFDATAGKVKRYSWTSQLRGANFKRTDNHTPEGLKASMEEVAGISKYDLFKHNCHKVQEALRRKLRLDVK